VIAPSSALRVEAAAGQRVRYPRVVPGQNGGVAAERLDRFV
jgi:hypothetical protein